MGSLLSNPQYPRYHVVQKSPLFDKPLFLEVCSNVKSAKKQLKEELENCPDGCFQILKNDYGKFELVEQVDDLST